ncbi:hypothetical protein K5549_008219 [Capra hircus]|uniref:PRELI/MSF1 domain-containing protein n=1 Tax=Capra hircus TaxID=9925 RepID=A0A452F0A4_CAPHI|nr:hypothetical protein K5549_008219 [Capra hircus]
MVKYFLGQSVLRSSWDQCWLPSGSGTRIPVATSEQKLLSRRLLTKTNRMPRWAERLFPANAAHSEHILEDSIMDPQKPGHDHLYVNHALLMVVEERCVYYGNSDNSSWTEICQEAWVSSTVQEFGLTWFKTKLQSEVPPKTLLETANETQEKAKETALAATEKAKDLAGKVATKQQQQQQFI